MNDTRNFNVTVTKTMTMELTENQVRAMRNIPFSTKVTDGDWIKAIFAYVNATEPNSNNIDIAVEEI